MNRVPRNPHTYLRYVTCYVASPKLPGNTAGMPVREAPILDALMFWHKRALTWENTWMGLQRWTAVAVFGPPKTTGVSTRCMIRALLLAN